MAPTTTIVRKPAAQAAKLAILTEIREKKDVLFGAFSASTTKQDKEKTWEEVSKKAKALGVLAATKDTKYFRDTTWQNWRRRAMEKRDKCRKTGEEGGEDAIFNEEESLIFDIVGRDSGILDGLPVAESAGTSKGETKIVVSSSVVEASEKEEEAEVVELKVSPISNSVPKRKRKGSEEVGAEEDLKRTRLEFQNEGLKLENFKKNLEILALERKLSLPESAFSKKFLADNYDLN